MILLESLTVPLSTIRFWSAELHETKHYVHINSILATDLFLYFLQIQENISRTTWPIKGCWVMDKLNSTLRTLYIAIYTLDEACFKT